MPLKTSALLKQVPLFVPIYYLTVTWTYMVYGNVCPLPRSSSSVQCTNGSDVEDPSNC